VFILVYCSKCGTENGDNATFCQNCGTRIKPKENKNGISKFINYKTILIVFLVFVVLFVISWVVAIASVT
jgi:ribosomal protein L40E